MANRLSIIFSPGRPIGIHHFRNEPHNRMLVPLPGFYMPVSPQICIIDDGADYRFLLQQVFKRYLPTYSVAFFASGQTFLYQLPKLDKLPCLILLDQHMPHMNGHEVLVSLKGHQAHKNIPVVMVSAEASRDEMSLCYEAGVNSFLKKSIDFDSMKNQMSMVCQYWLGINQTCFQDL